ncbi:MAG TPA: GNAT family N-acetyltransferase [Ruania sp.]|nr:GNAT family N-acetyltransferase [Ruania sp.]
MNTHDHYGDALRIEPYRVAHRSDALELAIRAWTPVFEGMRDAVPRFVHDNFWPNGWQSRQRADLAQVLDESPDDVDVAVAAGTVIGWVCTRIHPEDSMGEVYVIVVDPEHQGHGVGRALMDRAHARVRRAGMRMVMVETGGDPGHGAARRLYEAAGYQRWPVARYFKDLASDPMGPQLGSPEA